MRLIVVGSNSAGNSYALDAGNEVLLLEAGLRFAKVQKALSFNTENIAGCIVTHRHGDHAKFAREYAKRGIHIYGCSDVLDANMPDAATGRWHSLLAERTIKIGSFSVTPFENYHDVPIFGYLIYHPDMGILLFSTDSWKIGNAITGVNHYLIEANYSDVQLKENVWSGAINKAQADRIMLSHMSLEYCIRYLAESRAVDTASTITLCHLSERNSNPEVFRNMVASALGIPTYIAKPNVIIEINRI